MLCAPVRKKGTSDSDECPAPWLGPGNCDPGPLVPSTRVRLPPPARLGSAFGIVRNKQDNLQRWVGGGVYLTRERDFYDLDYLPSRRGLRIPLDI